MLLISSYPKLRSFLLNKGPCATPSAWNLEFSCSKTKVLKLEQEIWLNVAYFSDFLQHDIIGKYEFILNFVFPVLEVEREISLLFSSAMHAWPTTDAQPSFLWVQIWGFTSIINKNFFSICWRGGNYADAN